MKDGEGEEVTEELARGWKIPSLIPSGRAGFPDMR